MQITGIVHERIAQHMDIPTQDLSEKTARAIVIAKHLNLINIITDKSVITFPKGIENDTTSAKLARVLNLILLDHFDSVEEFLDTLNINHEFIHDLWTSNIRNPNHWVIKSLIREYDVDPIYLYGQKPEAFQELKKKTA